MAKEKTDKEKLLEHKFALIIFIDPVYKNGWRDRDSLPENKDALHVGCGVIIREDEKTLTLALAEELYDTTSDVMHPQLIHKDGLIKFYEFDMEFVNGTFGSKISKRYKGHIRRRIDRDVETFY